MNAHPILLVFLAVSLFACNSTRHVTLADGAPPPDQGPPDALPIADGLHLCSSNADCGTEQYCHIEGGCVVTGAKMGECRPRPEGCYAVADPVCGCDGTTYSNDCVAHAAGVNVAHKGPCSGVIVVTDRASYAAIEKVVGTVINNTASSVFLAGCSIFTWEKLVGSGWLDKGPTMICAWEGYAREVKPGGSRPEDQGPRGAGIWRLAALYGVGCTPNQPLSAAQCSAMATARSDTFTVGTTLEICIGLQSEYATALSAARKCSTSAPGQCTRKVLDSLACNCVTHVQDDTLLLAIQNQYLALGCDKEPGLPVCPPGACPHIQGAGCVQNKCVDFGPD